MDNTSKYPLLAEGIAHKGVWLVEKSDSVLEVLKIMDNRKISAVIVEDIDNLSRYYLISHSDIVHYLVKNQHDMHLIRDIKCEAVMRGPIKIIPKNTPIDKVILLMHKTGYKRVVVGNEFTQPIGIISTHDIITWNNDLFPPGLPILICLMEKSSGLIISQTLFKQQISADLIDLLGGSLFAISSITSEVLAHKSNLKLIEGDFYDLMLETEQNITAVLVVTNSSIDFRRKLQIFLQNFMDRYKDDILLRHHVIAETSHYRVSDLAKIFE